MKEQWVKAIKQGDIKEVENLLKDKSLDINMVDDEGRTALGILLESDLANASELIKILLKRGADVNKAAKPGYMPLHIAAKAELLNGITILLNYGANIDAKDKEGLTVFAYHYNEDDIFPLLQQNLTVTIKTPTTDENKKELNFLYKPTNLNVSYDDELTNLNISLIDRVGFSSTKQMEEDLMNGAHLHTYVKFDVENKSGLIRAKTPTDKTKPGKRLTPLLWAAEQEAYDAAERLLGRSNVVINQWDLSTGNTSLHIACQKGNLMLVQLLLQNQARINVRNFAGQTSLMLAAQSGNHALVSHLVEERAQMDVVDNEGNTALHYGVKHPQVVDTLLDAGANVRIKNKSGLIAANSLSQAAAPVANHMELLDKFQKHGAPSAAGPQLLIAAAKSGNQELVAKLIAEEYEINAVDNDDNTALHHAVKHPKVLDMLLEAGADAQKKNKKGHTAADSLSEERPNEGETEEDFLKRYEEALEIFKKNDLPINFFLLFESAFHANMETLAIFVLEQEKPSKHMLKSHMPVPDDKKAEIMFTAAERGSIKLIEAIKKHTFLSYDVRNEKNESPISYTLKYGTEDLINFMLENAYTDFDAAFTGTDLPILVGSAYYSDDNIFQKILNKSIETIRFYLSNHMLNFYDDNDQKNANTMQPMLYESLLYTLKKDIADGKKNAPRFTSTYNTVMKNTGSFPFFCNRGNPHHYKLCGLLFDLVSIPGFDSVAAAVLPQAKEYYYTYQVTGQKSKANLDNEYVNGTTALHRAIQCGNNKTAIVLAESKNLPGKCDINQEDEMSRTPLYYAAYFGHADVAKALVANSADPNKKAKDGNTPLAISILRKNTEACRQILSYTSKQIDFSIVDSEGNTLTHLDAIHNNGALSRALKNKGAPFDKKNKAGKLPVDCLHTSVSETVRWAFGSALHYTPDPAPAATPAAKATTK